RRPRHPHAPDAAHAGELHRVEPRAGEGGDGRDGPDRGGLPAAARPSPPGVEGADPGGAARPEAAQGGARLMMTASLAEEIEALVAAGAAADREAARAAFARLREALSTGTVRAAQPDASHPAGWRVNAWVKQGILLGFRFGDTVDVSMDHGRWPFYDKDTLPLRRFAPGAGVRIVPGGSSVRDGAYLAPGVICMPPMYVNIGAWIGEQSLIDSHALVGSC